MTIQVLFLVDFVSL